MGKSKSLFFFLVREGLNNDAVNFSKLFNPICVMKSHVKREKSELKGWWWWGGGDRQPERLIDHIIGPQVAVSRLGNQWFAAGDECPGALVSSLATLIPISSNLSVTCYLRTQLCLFFLFFFLLERLITLEVISQCRRSVPFTIPIGFHSIGAEITSNISLCSNSLWQHTTPRHHCSSHKTAGPLSLGSDLNQPLLCSSPIGF